MVTMQFLSATIIVAFTVSATRAATNIQTSSCRYVQCYEDIPGNRLLRGLTEADDYGMQRGDITVERCTEFCSGKGFRYAGLEIGSYCFCGDEFEWTPEVSLNCGSACGGNGAELCGGANALSVYSCNVESNHVDESSSGENQRRKRSA